MAIGNLAETDSDAQADQRQPVSFARAELDRIMANLAGPLAAGLRPSQFPSQFPFSSAPSRLVPALLAAG